MYRVSPSPFEGRPQQGSLPHCWGRYIVAWRREPQVTVMAQSDHLPRTPHGQWSVRRRRFGVDPPGLGRVGDECSFLAWGLRDQPTTCPPHSGLGCKGPKSTFKGATAMKRWKTSSATYEPRSPCPSFRLDPQWSGYGPILPQGTLRRPETGRTPEAAICSLPDFPEFAQAVRYGVLASGKLWKGGRDSNSETFR